MTDMSSPETNDHPELWHQPTLGQIIVQIETSIDRIENVPPWMQIDNAEISRATNEFILLKQNL